MNDRIEPADDEKRGYFRAEGAVYLRVDRPSSGKKGGAPEPPTLDRVEIHLLHLKNLLKYDPPPEEPYLRQIIHIMEQMHSHLTNKTKPMELERKDVVISGSGMEWIADEAYKEGEAVTLTLSFLEYPFQTVVTPAEILACEKTKKDGKTRYRTTLSYSEIPESQRDLIIKFVNHLQRKRLSQQREKNENP